MNKQRPSLLTVIAILGITYASVGLLLGLIALFTSAQLITSQVATVELGVAAKSISVAVGLFAVAFVGSGVLRIAIAVGMLKMKHWAYKLFYIIVVLSALSALAAILVQVAITWHVFFFVVELAILWYLHSIRSVLS